jgi:hypothetical protein
MKIERALDWDIISVELSRQLKTIDYNSDLKRLYKNIDGMITELSKLEVSVRRNGRYNFLTDRIEKINNAINHLEKLILIAQLMR